MADLVRLAYYPFLPEVREAVAETGIDLPSVLSSTIHSGVRERAFARIVGSIGEGFPPAHVFEERDALRELLSVAVARITIVAIKDRQLTRRYATAEADHLGKVLELQPDDVADIAAALDVPLRQTDGYYRVQVPDYLKIAPVQNREWRMLLRPVEKGEVILDPETAAKLCQAALRKRIETELEAESERPLPDDIAKAVEPICNRLEPLLEEAREHWNTGDFGPVQPGLFPPCMNMLFGLMNEGKNIPHHGRFAFASFMGNVGMNAEQVMDYLSATPNFDREKSRYQIEHITGERGVDKYTPPGCQSMQSNGICPLDKRDGLCLKIKHPLSYYRAKLRFQAQDQAKAAAIMEANRMTGKDGTPETNPYSAGTGAPATDGAGSKEGSK